MSTISYTQPYPSKQHSTSIQGQQIGMSILDTSHSHLAITPGDKFHDQWIVILLMQKKSKINDVNLKLKHFKGKYF